MKCPSCRLKNPDRAKFCMECGQDLRSKGDFSPDSFRPRKYTPKFIVEKIFSGRNALEGERKQVTVLFADVADFTAVAEKLDPEDVHEIMDGCFRLLTDAVHKYEGTINQFTGDGIMALFGAPLAHEDHAIRACHAALSIQKALGPYSESVGKRTGQVFRMRIGLNTGTVIVGAIGDDLRMDYTAIGDTTNLACRMEKMAAPGIILVSDSTQKKARAFFEFEFLGAFSVKGKEVPQEAFKLLGPRKDSPRISSAATLGLSPFVGRNDAISFLDAAFARAKSGSGQVVDIIGEAGVGKSRVVMEFTGRLNPSEFICFEGGCLHYGGAMAYLPIQEILKALFSIQDTDAEKVISEKISCGLCSLDVKRDVCLPPLQDFFSLENDDPAYFQIGPEERKMRIMKTFGELMIQSALCKPLILVIEDLHWTDKATEEFIRFFVPQICNANILLLCLYRPPFLAPWYTYSHYSRISMLPLDRLSGGLLIRSILTDSGIDPDLESQILEKAGGNPLFIEELTYHLLETGMVLDERKDGLSDTPIAEVPDTIENVIAARIDRLEQHSKKLLQIASVIGREFDPELLTSISGEEAPVTACLAGLKENDFILEKQSSPVAQYVFKHSIVQDVAYNSLIQKKRKAIHEKIARYVERLNPGRLQENCELLAYHYLKGGRTEKALDYLEMANQKSIRLSVLQEAMHSFTEACRILDKMEKDDPSVGERRIRLIVDQYYTFFSHLKIIEYLELLLRYESNVMGTQNPLMLTRYFSAVSACHTYFGHFDKAVTAAGQAVATANKIGHPEYALEAYAALFFSHFHQSDFNAMRQIKEEISSLMQRHFNLHVYGHIAFADSYAQADAGYTQNAIEIAQDALTRGERYSNDTVISLSLIHLAVAYCLRNEMTPALEYGNLAVCKAELQMATWWVGNLHAYILCRSGAFERGIPLLEQNRAIMQMIQNLPVEAQTLIFLGEGYWRAGDYTRASEALTEGKNLSEGLKMKSCTSLAHHYLGEIALANNPEKAAEHFKRSMEIAREKGLTAHLARAYSGLGRYHKQYGELDAARKNLRQSLEIYNELDILEDPDAVRRELANLPGGK